MMQGLTPADLYNLVVSAEQELYRLGTSGYRFHLHPTILRGIKDAKSFEAFLETTALTRLGVDAEAKGRRGLVFLRIAASFGLLDGVLETVQDREAFVAQVIGALGDPLALEGSGAVVLDLLTARSPAPVVADFKALLLDRLYEAYRRAGSGPSKTVYGSLLATYQAIANDRRDTAIDNDFPVDRAIFTRTFDQLFSRDSRGQPIHRMFMRFDEDVDALRTHESVRRLMAARGAKVRGGAHHDVYTLERNQRTIEIYANKPTTAGTRLGIGELARKLDGLRVETVIGRGHTGIIQPLQRDARRILGTRVKDIASLIVGSCGGNASARRLIDTFGYVPFIASKSTGRQVLNNAILETYLDALFALETRQQLTLQPVLDRALAPFLVQREADLRNDAGLYVVNTSTALAAYVFDRHARPLATGSLPVR